MTTDVPESKKDIETTNSAAETDNIENATNEEQATKIETAGSMDTVENTNTTISTDKELTIGEQLQEKRLELGLSEREVATSLKISIDQVQALEKSDFDYFLSVTFARGFLKSYCRLLGLNQVAMLGLFDSKRANVASTIKPVDKVNKQTHLGDPIVIFISVVIVAVLVFLVFWWPTESAQTLISDDETVNETSEVAQVEEPVTTPSLTASEPKVDEANAEVATPATIDNELVPTQADAATDNETETNSDVATGLSAETVAILEEAGVSPDDVVRATKVVPATEPVTQPEPTVPSYKEDIEIAFSDDCWTEIRDGSGTILFSGVKTAGSTLSLTGSAPYRVVLGYSSGVSSLKYKGEDFDFSSFIRQDLARFELK